MSEGSKRQDELFAMAVGARRRDTPGPRRDPKAPQHRDRSVPTPQDDLLSEFFASLTPAQRELYRRILES